MTSNSMKQKVLILGCGLVAPPLVEYLNSHKIHQTIATRTPSKAEAISVDHPELLNVVCFDVDGKEAEARLEELTKTVDLVVSLLPYVHHPMAAAVAIRLGKHFCTASYVSENMQKLDSAAREKGVILLNECGVDPGLDHMSAKKIIDEVHSRGGKVIEFSSLCGGLPAPDANDNPWGYKLSWSPRGVLQASKNSARYLSGGKSVEVPGSKLFAAENVHHETVKSIGQLEWYLNRDSVKYQTIYDIPECSKLVRGTYRYVGWSRLLKAISDLNLHSDETVALSGLTYLEASKKLLGTQDDPRQAIATKLGISPTDEIISKLDWIGMFSPDLLVPDGTNTALDALCHLCQQKLVYLQGEKDMIVMQHVFDIEYSRQNRESVVSTLIDFGRQDSGGHSSMARTVSLPLAVAVNLILNGSIKLTGVQRPVVPEIYTPILNEMAALGVCFHEETKPTLVWIRDEVKPGEERVALTPSDCSTMLQAGYEIAVERSTVRCFKDPEYENIGCRLVETGSWPTAPNSAFIIGLKELPDSPNLLIHRHIFFAHCFKGQSGWRDTMRRFTESSGLLLDLEFLKISGRRVAAFGRAAGANGAAIGLLAWAAQQTRRPLGQLSSWESVAEMVNDVRNALTEASNIAGRMPTIIVIGCQGRCGGGAVWLAEQCDLSVSKWDLEKTKVGGPFPELLGFDVMVNCIYLKEKITPFITTDLLIQPNRNLSVMVDVSCDMSNPFNPVPVYASETSFRDPVLTVIPQSESQRMFQVVAIDHLPSLTPKESSEGFSTDLLPTLLQINIAHTNAVWQGAEEKFWESARRL
eukprot:167435_1